MKDKIIELIISAIIKKGVLTELRNVEIPVEIPNGEKSIKINIKCEHVKISLDKEV